MDCVVTDQTDLTSTSTRTVIVEPAGQASTSADETASSTATTTDATTTAQ